MLLSVVTGDRREEKIELWLVDRNLEWNDIASGISRAPSECEDIFARFAFVSYNATKAGYKGGRQEDSPAVACRFYALLVKN